MKTILRNLFYTLKRFQTASVLNLMGLSAAFAAFVLLMMKVSYERDFDTCYPHTDRLVMLNLAQPQEVNYVSTLPRGPIDFLIQQIQNIKYGTNNSPTRPGRSRLSTPTPRIRNTSMRNPGPCIPTSEKLSD